MRLVIEATKEMIYGAQKSSEWCILDVRSSDAYIGWKRENEIGGHIPYAKFFSAEWLKTIWRDGREEYEFLLDLQLQAQMITPDKKIIIYDEDALSADLVCNYLAQKGFEHIFYYNLRKWDGDLFKYPKHCLVAPMWLVNEMLKGNSEKYGIDSNYKIFEISWNEPSEQYLEAHIPGAVHIDSNEFEIPPKWIMVDDEKLVDFAMKNGITPDTTVVVYGNTTLNMDAAMKLATVLRYIGIKNVMCLNGTIKNWIKAGYPTEQGEVAKEPCTIDSRSYIFDRKQIYHMSETKYLLEHPQNGAVVDTRSWKCYIGEHSGYDYLDKAGRIPGAIWCQFPMNFMNPINQVGNIEIMLNVLETKGIDLKKTTAFFCGSASWGAAVNKTLANMAGFTNATIYEGGWCEWCQDPDNKVEKGIPDEYKDYDPEKVEISTMISEESCHVM